MFHQREHGFLVWGVRDIDHALVGLPLPPTRGGILSQFETSNLIVRGAIGWNITNLGAVTFAKEISMFPTIARNRFESSAIRARIASSLNAHTMEHVAMQTVSMDLSTT